MVKSFIFFIKICAILNLQGCKSTFTARVILVGGGGGGAMSAYWEGGGGGGAGGVGIGNIRFTSNISYTFTIGNGGAAIPDINYVAPTPPNGATIVGNNGGNTSIVGGTINQIAYGGAGGGITTGPDGGSGGGGCGVNGGKFGGNCTEGLSTKSNDSYVVYNGNIGGIGWSTGYGAGGGGGGGANLPGNNSTGTNLMDGGNGGNGKLINLVNTNYYFGGGGGSCGVYRSGWFAKNGGTGGLGGGGRGISMDVNLQLSLSPISLRNATNFTGGGGGGGGPVSYTSAYTATAYGSGSGGSGIIIIIYPKTINNTVYFSKLNNSQYISLSEIKNKNPIAFSNNIKFSTLILSSNVIGIIPAFPAKNATDIINFTGCRIDNSYYINSSDISTLTYCLLDNKYNGGGWMMMMKATNSSTFTFNANYWNTYNVLNNTNVNRNDEDAKYDIYNNVNIKDIMVLWPYVQNANNAIQYTGGSINTLTDAWSWLDTNWYYGFNVKGIYGFNNQHRNPSSILTPQSFNGWNINVWSTQTYSYYVYYSTRNAVGGISQAPRYGFLCDDVSDLSSPNVCGGIGLPTFSGGDFIASGAVTTGVGVNKALRFELYGR